MDQVETDHRAGPAAAAMMAEHEGHFTPTRFACQWRRLRAARPADRSYHANDRRTEAEDTALGGLAMAPAADAAELLDKLSVLTAQLADGLTGGGAECRHDVLVLRLGISLSEDIRHLSERWAPVAPGREHPDADLIRACEAFDSIERQRLALSEGPSAIASDRECDEAVLPLRRRQAPILDTICSTPAASWEGVAALTRTALLEDRQLAAAASKPDDRAGFVNERLAAAVMRNVARVAAAAGQEFRA